MPAITQPEALRFSNESIRPAADLLARAYYRGDHVRDAWDALGGGQAAINLLAGEMRQAADAVYTAFAWSYWREKLWFLHGATALIPASGDSIADGRTDVPAITGAQAVAVVDRMVQFQNWLLSGTGDFTDTARNATSYLNTVLALTSNGPATITVADAGNFMTRCSELRSRYEATSGAELNSLLTVAVNPNPFA